MNRQKSGENMRLGFAIAAIILAFCMAIAPAVAAATAYTITVVVVGPDKMPVKGAKVIVYDKSGKAYEGVTDASGVAKIEVPDNDTYLVEVKAGNYIVVDAVHVEGDTSKTIDVSTMHHANITSTPVSVGVSIQYGIFETKLNLTTNITVYAPAPITVSYPEEVAKIPFKYVLKKISYDGVEVEDTKVTLDMSKDYMVVAVYEKTFPASLNMWLAILFAIIVIAAVVIAFVAGGRKAKEIIGEWRESKMRFVRKR